MSWLNSVIVLITIVSLPQISLSLCRYRNIGDLPPVIFSYWSDWGCYTYTRPDLFAGEQLKASICYLEYNETLYDIPGIIREQECIPFSYRDEIVRSSVERTFENIKTVERWIRCCKDAEKCCKNIMMQNVDIENHCPSVWDGWSCFNQIPSGNTYSQVCSPFAYAGQPPQCHHYSSKTCNSNGTWEVQTDYSSCDITPRLIFRTLWHISLLIISIVLCMPAILVLTFYRNLHTEKLILIRTLLITIVLRYLIILLVKGTLILDELTTVEPTAMSVNHWTCKLLTFLEKFTGTGVFSCMLLEGIYLHQILTNVFRSRIRGGVHMKELYVFSFVLTLLVSLIWALAMWLNDEKNCWQVTEGKSFHWIFDGPRLIMLIVNFGLLLRIVRTLWRTFRHRQEETHPAFRTAKAAIICLPLFGVPFLFLIIRPHTTDCAKEQFYYIVYYVVEALQGILISILHCYSEREVKAKFTSLFRSIEKKLFDIYYWTGRFDKIDCAGNMSPTSANSRCSFSKTRPESETSVATSATPQSTDCRERASFSLTRIQEDEDRKISVASLHKLNKRWLSTGNCTKAIKVSHKINQEKLRNQKKYYRRHSAGEVENNRTEDKFI